MSTPFCILKYFIDENITLVFHGVNKSIGKTSTWSDLCIDLISNHISIVLISLFISDLWERTQEHNVQWEYNSNLCGH